MLGVIKCRLRVDNQEAYFLVANKDIFKKKILLLIPGRFFHCMVVFATD